MGARHIPLWNLLLNGSRVLVTPGEVTFSLGETRRKAYCGHKPSSPVRMSYDLTCGGLVCIRLSLEMLSSGNFRVTVNPQRSRKVCCVLGSPNLAGKALTCRTNRMVKNLPAMPETWVQSWVGEMPWRRKWQPTPGFLPGELHGLRSLVGYSPWGHKQSDMTEQLYNNNNKTPQRNLF